MTINNLSQLKKAVNAKTPFQIVQHFLHPDFTGQIRVPNILQTNAFYSVIKDEPNHPVSLANGGMGYRMDYGKADSWDFTNGICRAFVNRRYCGEIQRVPVFEIQFLEG